MKTSPRRRPTLAVLALSLFAGLTLLTAVPVLAQESQMPSGAAMAMGAAFFVVFLLIFAVFYIYMALALQTIAKKTNAENPWLAWIPIANVILMLNIAKKPLWWIVLCLVPFVNIVIFVIIWMGVAEARNKPNWWGILIIVPVANLIVPGYLAWAD